MESITYLAIGSAHGIGGNQQFPPFLQRACEFVHEVRIILVDPELEMPPNVTTFQDMETLYQEEIDSVNVFHCNFHTTKITIFVWKQYWDCGLYEKTFRSLLRLASVPKSCFFAHDFSGKSNETLNQELQPFLSTITPSLSIIGLGLLDQSCFPDLELFGPILMHSKWVDVKTANIETLVSIMLTLPNHKPYMIEIIRKKFIAFRDAYMPLFVRQEITTFQKNIAQEQIDMLYYIPLLLGDDAYESIREKGMNGKMIANMDQTGDFINFCATSRTVMMDYLECKWQQ